MKHVILFVDYREQFYSSLRVSTGGMDIPKIVDKFNHNGFFCEVIEFSDFDVDRQWAGKFVLYQSSEDRGLYYKSYISDILLYIKEQGGILIPEYQYFHAHENKVYQSLLSSNVDNSIITVPNTIAFGAYEELLSKVSDISFPRVIKLSSGCQSKGVSLVKTKRQCLKKAKRMMSSFNLVDYLRFNYKRLLKKGYSLESLNRKKIVLQSFIPKLPGDYKVLIYNDKVFVLTRSSRPTDFRASGSGIFKFDTDVPDKVLDAANYLQTYYNCPYMSIDIAYEKSNDQCYLIEYQFLMFGTYTLEKSPHYFKKINGAWEIVNETSNLESVFVDSVSSFINVSEEIK
ncbi:ATP-grasp domain-containing protein [Salinivibrio costicola]|uniref:ATP-grasp domain-containing protein n=1 Tax=Salinivibrio costicola subsp. alcaliphilus TaxID=272773 RepID=A0ABX3KNQ6_SALCS|nr:hypothetical protein [Salinivibrio costicola]OOF32786.1 hypothetical protein BZJ21_14315 [Salinivibrio costicola subsp. alcaliphilus]